MLRLCGRAATSGRACLSDLVVRLVSRAYPEHSGVEMELNAASVTAADIRRDQRYLALSQQLAKTSDNQVTDRGAAIIAELEHPTAAGDLRDDPRHLGSRVVQALEQGRQRRVGILVDG
jgi:hypothetical protein